MTWAMTLLAAFGLGYNLVALSGRSTRGQRLFTGGLTAALVGVIGSLEGALELGFIRGWGPQGLYRFLDVRNLVPGGNSCGDDAPGFGQGGWIPTRFIWWWRGSRVIHDNCGEVIHEFPFFSFMLGDVHPHLVALPYTLVVLGLALAILTGALERPNERPLWSWRWLALPLVVGALGFLNAWDLPTYAFVVVVAYGLRVSVHPPWTLELTWPDRLLAAATGLAVLALSWRLAPGLLTRVTGVPAEAQPVLSRAALSAAVLLAGVLLARFAWTRALAGDATAGRLLDVGRFAVWLALLSFAFYLPFHLGFQSQASGIGLVTVRTRLGQWLVHFGFLAFLALSLILAVLVAVRRRPLTAASFVLMAVALPFLGLAAFWRAWTVLALVLSVTAAGIAASQLWASALASPGDDAAADRPAARFAWPGEGGWPAAPTFALVCLAVGLLMPLGTEVLFIRDLFGSRMNTIFKLYYQAWALLAIGGGFTAFALTRLWSPRAVRAWAIPAVVLLAGSLIYPAASVTSRTNGFRAERLTLNGLSWWERVNPDDLAAVEWLKAHARGAPVVLEAPGGGYEHNGRISMATGFPTLLGWEGHEHQWRGERQEIDPRKADIERLYKSTEPAELKQLLAKYNVRYVIVGDPEIAKFALSAADIDRFRRELTPVFESGRLHIFESP
jgi:YYY domain-containing protein